MQIRYCWAFAPIYFLIFSCGCGSAAGAFDPQEPSVTPVAANSLVTAQSRPTIDLLDHLTTHGAGATRGDGNVDRPAACPDVAPLCALAVIGIVDHVCDAVWQATHDAWNAKATEIDALLQAAADAVIAEEWPATCAPLAETSYPSSFAETATGAGAIAQCIENAEEQYAAWLNPTPPKATEETTTPPSESPTTCHLDSAAPTPPAPGPVGRRMQNIPGTRY